MEQEGDENEGSDEDEDYENGRGTSPVKPFDHEAAIPKEGAAASDK
jgi:hypothetical protein